MSFNIYSPHDGRAIKVVNYTAEDELNSVLNKATRTQSAWAQVSIKERVAILTKGIECFLGKREELARELSELIGRPLQQCPKEIEGFAARARYLLNLAEQELAPVAGECDQHNKRIIVKEPVGVVLIIGAWNFPYNVIVNTLIPALAAGNAVIIKHALQTAPVGENLVAIFKKGGLPEDLLAAVKLTNERTEQLVGDSRINYVSLVGSPRAGRAVLQASARRPHDFIKVSLELGGCDGAYVREDADLAKAIPELLDGAFFNSGQSCCGVQRIFVHQGLYKAFVEAAKKEAVSSYQIGKTLGPVITKDAAAKVSAAVSQDAGRCEAFVIPLPKDLPAEHAYCEPTILIDPPHGTNVLSNEIFGPIVAISPVASDEEAVNKINDVPLGLTASIWTKDIGHAEKQLAPRLVVGTVYINRCDTVHPSLPWSGAKLSGLAFTLSKFAYDQVTRFKSINIGL